MKTVFYVLIAMFPLAGCTSNNNGQAQKYKETASKDSAMLVLGNQEDSEMTSYLGELRGIGDNLDRITSCENVIVLTAAQMNPINQGLLITEVKELDQLIIKNDKKMNELQIRLKKITVKNTNLESLAARLKLEIIRKDGEVNDLQAKLYKANNSLQPIIDRFNDSMIVIKNERSQSVNVKNKSNTGYFVAGTMKELQDKGIVNKEGGFLGIGKVLAINPALDNSKFRTTDLTNLKGVALNGKFRGLLTTHPNYAYIVIPNGKTDSIAITNPFAFWFESKYLVVAVK